MSSNKVNWLAIREPMRGVLRINTVAGLMEIPMHEPQDHETEDITKIWPMPPRPTKEIQVPIEDEKGYRLEIKIVADTSEEAKKKYEAELDEVLEWQALAYAEAAIDEGYKPEGNTKEERVAVLRSMPRQIRNKLIQYAQALGERKLAERFEEAKKS